MSIRDRDSDCVLTLITATLTAVTPTKTTNNVPNFVSETYEHVIDRNPDHTLHQLPVIRYLKCLKLSQIKESYAP